MAWCEKKQRDCPVADNIAKIRNRDFHLIDPSETAARFTSDQELMLALVTVVERLGELGGSCDDDGPSVEGTSEGTYVSCNHDAASYVYDLTNGPFDFALNYNCTEI